MMVNHFDATVEGTVVDHIARFWVQVNAVGTVREGLHAVAEFPFFCIVHFVDIGIAKAAHFYRADITHVEVGVQGRGRFKLAVRFQLNLAGFTQLEAGVQGKLVLPQRTGLVIGLKLKGQHGTVIIFVMRFQGPLLVAGKTMRRQSLLR